MRPTANKASNGICFSPFLTFLSKKESINPTNSALAHLRSPPCLNRRSCTLIFWRISYPDSTHLKHNLNSNHSLHSHLHFNTHFNSDSCHFLGTVYPQTFPPLYTEHPPLADWPQVRKKHNMHIFGFFICRCFFSPKIIHLIFNSNSVHFLFSFEKHHPTVPTIFFWPTMTQPRC